MALFKKKVEDELEYKEPVAEKKPSLVMKVLKHKAFIPVCAIIVLLVLVKILLGVFSSQKSDMGYYDTIVSIFSNELGSFSYTFSVETGDKGTIIKENVAPDYSEIESGEDIDGSSSSGSGKEFVGWDKYAEVKTDNWKYPIFRVSIVGTTMSLDPLTSNFTVTIATPSHNAKFTEVTVRDDTYYFDVESMYNWLSDSSDAYLMSLAKEIPHGSKWLEVSASEFSVPSRYAENGDEQELSAAHSLKTLYQRFLVALKTSVNSVSGSLGDRGVDRKKDVVYLNLVGDDAVALVSAAKSIATRSGDFYESLISTSASAGLYNESQQKQALREKDNFITAMSDMAMALQMCKPSELGLQASGQVRQYVNGYGNNQVEGVFGIQFSSDTADYIVKFNGIRSGDKADIVVPDGSKTTENADMYLSAFNSMVDYFNFTPIKTDVKLSINPNTISQSILDQFIKLVNDTGTAGYWVTRDNVSGFIDKYKDLKDTDVQNEDELRNLRLVTGLSQALDSVLPRGSSTANVPVDNPPVVDEPEQFPDIDWNMDGAEISIRHDADSSNHDLFVVDCEVINKSDSEVVINCADFVAHDLLNSIYPANNETLIRDYDNVFDMSQLSGEVTIPGSGWAQFKLYFVISEDKGHVDLFYGDTQLGAMIQF